MEHQYVAFTSKEIEVLIKIMELVIKSGHDTVTIQMPADTSGLHLNWRYLYYLDRCYLV